MKTKISRSIKYGYLHLPAKQKNEFKKFFPKGKFNIKINETILKSKHIDWTRNRIHVGNELKNNFNEKDQVEMTKHFGNTILFKKK